MLPTHDISGNIKTIPLQFEFPTLILMVFLIAIKLAFPKRHYSVKTKKMESTDNENYRYVFDGS